jgi:predicted RNase H-like nuclease
VLEVETYAEANALSRNLTGKGLSKQSWNLVPKIRDVDTFMRTSVGEAGSRIIESHPELCMAALFGGPMHHNKKTLQGYEERLHRLSGLYPDAEGVVHEALGRFRRQDMARDDIVDALALAVTAWKCEGRMTEVPTQPQHDSCGLPMRIAFYPRQERHLP